MLMLILQKLRSFPLRRSRRRPRRLSLMRLSRTTRSIIAISSFVKRNGELISQMEKKGMDNLPTIT
jgi:hypothetical protein